VGTTVSINNVSGNNTVAVPLSLGGDLSVAASGTVTLSGGVSGNGGVTVNSGTVDLSGNNSYAGATLLKGGTLKATYNGSSSITATNSGVTFIANMGVNTPAWAAGALSSIAAQMTNATLGVDATGTTVALTDAIANTNGGVTVAAYGNGTLSLVSDTDYTGVSNWKANGGTLSVTNVNALGTNSVTLTGGALSYDGGADTTIANNVTVTAGGFTGSIVNNTGYTLGLTGTLTKNNAILKLLKGAFNVTGNIEGSLANSDLFVSGATATLSGTNTYNGPTHIDTGATVTLGSATALPAATSLELGSASDTAEQVNGLNLAGYSATVSALNSTGLSSAKVYDTVGGGTLTVNGDSTFAGSIGDSVLGNNLNLTVGAGTASLSGNNSFTGVATVNSGAAINLGTTGQLSGVSTVNLNGGSLLIGGNNQVNSAANLSMNGGTVSLASTSTGSSFSNLTLTGNSVINFSGLTAGSSLTFTGVVNSLGGNTLSVYNYNPGVTSLVFNGESFGGLTDTDLSNVRFFSDNGLTSLGSAGGSFSGTEIVPVPEPSVILAAILMVALMAFAKREEISRLARRVTVR
jgi:autotransporter-associated beta strand protein